MRCTWQLEIWKFIPWQIYFAPNIRPCVNKQLENYYFLHIFKLLLEQIKRYERCQPFSLAVFIINRNNPRFILYYVTDALVIVVFLTILCYQMSILERFYLFFLPSSILSIKYTEKQIKFKARKIITYIFKQQLIKTPMKFHKLIIL